ncbi:MAG: hypothetical protein AAGC74_03240 [Verrucomicrobiota bacterium]
MSPDLLLTSALNDSTPPENLSPELHVLWLAKAGQWHQSHDIAQNLPDPNGSWLHAYLHRLEGDDGNASYWYHRANKPTPPQTRSLDDEWFQLARHFCK